MKIDSLKMVLFTALFVLLIVPAAFAEKLTFAPTADAYFGSDVRDQANNTEILTCQWADIPDSGTINVTWIKFNIEGLSSEIIEKARLDIAVAGTGGFPPTILVVTAPNEWEEGQLTWDNHPKMNETIHSGWFPEEIPTDQQIISFPILPQALANGELTLALVPQPGDSSSEDFINFHSSTGAISPMLTVYTIDETITELEIEPLGDATCNRSNADGNNGDHSALAVQWRSKGDMGRFLQGIIAFDLSTLSGRYISEATLEFTQGGGTGFRNGPTIALRVCGNDWDEFEVTWNNRPQAEALCVGGFMQDTVVVNNGDLLQFPIVPQAFRDKQILSLYLYPQTGNELWWDWGPVARIGNDATVFSYDGEAPPLLRVKTIANINTIHKDIHNPVDFALDQNYPNPFNPSTTISYNLAKLTRVDLTVYNVQGQKVATLVNNAQPAGQHQVTWNAAGMPSGVYYFQIQTTAGFTQTNKMILLK